MAGRYKISEIFVASLITIFLLSGCQFFGGNNPADTKIESADNAVKEQVATTTGEKPPLKIGIFYFPTFLFWYLAEDQGYFEDEGLNAEIIYYDSIPEYIDAMSSGELDIMGLAFMDVFSVRQEGLPIKTIIAADYSYGADAIVARKDSGIDGIKDLKGKKIGVEQGAVSEFFLDFVLTRRAELDVTDVEKVNMTASDTVDAFANKEVDVIITYEPYVQEVLAQGDAKIIFDTSNERGLIEDVGVAEESKLAANKEDYIKAFRAWFRAIDYYKENPEDAAAIIGKRVGVTGDEYLAQLDGLYIMDLRDNITALSVASGAESLYGTARLILDFYESRGLGEGLPDTAEIIDDSIVKAISSNTQ